jgi:hypothetical protein
VLVWHARGPEFNSQHYKKPGRVRFENFETGLENLKKIKGIKTDNAVP